MPPATPPHPSRRTLAKASALGLATAFAATRPALAARPAPGSTGPSGAVQTRAGEALAPAGVTATRLGPRTYDLSVPSAALGRTAPVRVILPASHAAHPARTWPVLHLLHGAHDDYTSWTRETDIERFTYDRDVIVAMPDGGPTGIPTRWRDGTDYETFQVAEVPAVLARDFRASGTQAVAGVSTGGYGAMAHAARNPGRFAAAASYSGILDTTYPGVPAVVDAIVARENLPPRSLWGSPLLNVGTWRDFNPRARASGLRGTALYVSTGSGVAGDGGDELLPRVLESLLWPAVQSFTALLRLMRLGATTHLYAGGEHGWNYWQREFTASWPLLARALGVPA
ncbi:alpha/beta hydrolase-fold protein [Streptomyces sp. 549]|uniref:alpha/beta hydrolase n=1 Tax=Streptomyces sp. 549 TaxID=3049076 RepID=UPI0024C275F7|nr:alpha/beta hydrolase family protein [Streptomyces sp. 549]MDK1474720.1 alpha/beta hydrolase-fold protein [Streptomyces sp. 549]